MDRDLQKYRHLQTSYTHGIIEVSTNPPRGGLRQIPTTSDCFQPILLTIPTNPYQMLTISDEFRPDRLLPNFDYLLAFPTNTNGNADGNTDGNADQITRLKPFPTDSGRF